MALAIERSAPVLVTGATGYLAGWLVKRLLDEGLTVHAAVRDPDDADKLKYLERVARNAPGRLRFFQADLLAEGSYAEAMAGCRVVFHTASPFIVHVADPQRDLLEPALLGTRNVLNEVERTPSVTRVVLTSSTVAIGADNADLEKAPHHLFTEEDWNTTSSLAHQPYAYSKTVAEREAWRLNAGQGRWHLVTINPSLVIGPGLNPYGTSESFRLVKQLGDGSLKNGVPKMGLGVVDVRDVAEAHFRAAFVPEAKGRYLVSGHNSDFPALAAALLDRFGDDYPIPRRVMPKWLVWLVGPLLNRALTRKMVTRNVDLDWLGDNSKSIRELGLQYRPLKESMVEFFQQMVDSGLVKKPQG